MTVLVDTNVLLRSVQPNHPMHAAAQRALATLMTAEDVPCITVQNVAEFWNTATRPIAQNGLGMTIEEAQQELIALENYFEILTENATSYAEWKTLLTTKRVRGVQAHDARLVSVMKAHGIQHIVTFDAGDFSRFSEIQVLHPNHV